jgi:hypothetical protein
LRAGRFGFRPLRVIALTLARALRAFGFAVLTPLGLIPESLIGEKHLFAGGENKLLTAFRTLQDLIMVFHTLLRGSTLVAEPAASSDGPENTEKPSLNPVSTPDSSEGALEIPWAKLPACGT